MVRRTVNTSNDEPENMDFTKPSEGRHLLQVVEVFDFEENPHPKLNLGPDDVSAKLEVAEGPEIGRTLLHRMTINEEEKFFFRTRQFLKAISEPYKGKGILINSENWQGRKLYSTVVHNGKYANLDKIDLDNLIEQEILPPAPPAKNAGDEIAWDSDLK